MFLTQCLCVQKIKHELSFISAYIIFYNCLGLVLLLIPNRKMKKVANIVLLLTKVLNLYSHFAIEDLFERMAPTLVFFFMLVCRMVVDWQFDKTLAAEKVKNPQFLINQTNQFCCQVEPVEVEGSYDKVDIRAAVPRTAKNKKD